MPLTRNKCNPKLAILGYLITSLSVTTRPAQFLDDKMVNKNILFYLLTSYSTTAIMLSVSKTYKGGHTKMLSNTPQIMEEVMDAVNNTYELDAGEVVWFDEFKNEWVTLGGR